MTGLRARDTATRQKFFALYNSAIECTLFARMRYIIVEQDWEQLAAFFWLKQALVRCRMLDAAESPAHPASIDISFVASTWWPILSLARARDFCLWHVTF